MMLNIPRSNLTEFVKSAKKNRSKEKTKILERRFAVALNTNSQEPAPALLCPLMSRIHVEVAKPDARLVGSGQAQVMPIFAPVECQKEKCGFFHRGRGFCSIPLIADLSIRESEI